MKPCLYVVATPIGHLDDFSPRAQATLRSVDLICCEDTRHSNKLLQHFGIHVPLLSLHEHNEKQRIDYLITQLQAGKQIALISDAGTPLISDPGFPLVRALKQAGFEVIPIPGPCALITALSVAGIATDRFIFEGFLPNKSSSRLAHLKSLRHETRTLIFYESSHRILDSLIDLQQAFGAERLACIGREMTKKFEAYHTETLQQLYQYFEAHSEQVRGEFVVIIEGQPEVNHDTEQLTQLDHLLNLLLTELPLKKAVSIACQLTSLKKNFIYERALQHTHSQHK